MNQNIGIQSIKDVLLAYLDMHGTMLIMNVLAAIYQDKSLEIIVHVLHQKQFGIMQVKLVSVQQMLTETIVFHALFQDNGIFKTTPVFVPPYNLMERSKFYMSSRGKLCRMSFTRILGYNKQSMCMQFAIYLGWKELCLPSAILPVPRKMRTLPTRLRMARNGRKCKKCECTFIQL